jgi:hypothetical protein
LTYQGRALHAGEDSMIVSVEIFVATMTIVGAQCTTRKNVAAIPCGANNAAGLEVTAKTSHHVARQKEALPCKMVLRLRAL